MLIYFLISLIRILIISKKEIIFTKYKKWQPTSYRKDWLISCTKKYIHQKLNDPYKELECTNQFIFDFIEDIQHDWDPYSYKSKSEKLFKESI